MNLNVGGLDLPALDSNHKLHWVLTSALGQKHSQTGVDKETPPWNADFFGLTQIPLYQEADPAEQAQILQQASQDLLTEAYCLEKAGMGYMAKMTLLAETTEERMLYALFCADETQHLAKLSPFVSEADATQGANALFLRLLVPLLDTADRAVLMFVIQVVLEGWGLSHYRSLSRHCLNPDLAERFRSFLQAEARHHGTGVTLFDRSTLSAASRAAIVEALAGFLQMVRIGPQRLVTAIATVKGDLSRSQRIGLLTELDTETHSGVRLALLRSLIAPVAPDIAETLEEQNLFSPLPPAQCVPPA